MCLNSVSFKHSWLSFDQESGYLNNSSKVELRFLGTLTVDSRHANLLCQLLQRVHDLV